MMYEKCTQLQQDTTIIYALLIMYKMQNVHACTLLWNFLALRLLYPQTYKENKLHAWADLVS